MGVDGDVDLAGQQRVFEFLGEDALAAEGGQGPGLVQVALGLDDDDLGRHPRAGGQEVADVMGLPEGEVAAAGAQADGFHGGQDKS